MRPGWDMEKERGPLGREEEKTKEGLPDRLAEHIKSGGYPYHMPGHKRNLPVSDRIDRDAGQILRQAARMDITEIDGFDNLHAPEGILQEAMEKAARLYGADSAFYSVNGSTAGILTAISAAVPWGGTLIMARNCHRSVYHGIYLRRLKPVYLYPPAAGETDLAGAVSPEQVERALCQHPEAAAVLIVSPTYDGVTADVAAIAEIAHAHGKPLLVDSAHGAHFGFHPAFPESAVRCGADYTVVSLHKTMPCLTQTALLLVNAARADLRRVRMFESMYQTSSPSYVLMAAMDACMDLVQERGSGLWETFFEDRAAFYRQTERLRFLRVLSSGKTPDGREKEDTKAGAVQGSPLDGVCLDPCKILIHTAESGLSGKALSDILRERYQLQMEMAAGEYVTAIMTCCDTKEGWERLAVALLEIDASCRQGTGERKGRLPVYPRLETVLPLSDALDGQRETVPLEAARGRVSADFIHLYPPGIPIVVPGERLEETVIGLLRQLLRQGFFVQGVNGGAIAVLAGADRPCRACPTK